MKKRGRPRSGDAKNEQLKVRIGYDERYMLDCLSDKTGDNCSEIMRKALKHYYFHVF